MSVAFLSFQQDRELAGVMGAPDFQDVTLMRHAFEAHGCRVVSSEEKELLLSKGRTAPDRQMETSMVLARPSWLSALRKIRVLCHPRIAGQESSGKNQTKAL